MQKEQFMLILIVASMLSTLCGEKKVSKFIPVIWQFIAMCWVISSMLLKQGM